MTLRTRHLALTATGVGLVAALIAADHTTKRRSSRPANTILVHPLVTTRDGLDRSPGPAAAARVEATAREFIHAYLPYTHGHSSPLRRLPFGAASPDLVDRLLTVSPHARHGESRPDVLQGVRVERLTDRDAIALARVTGPAGSYAVALTVHRGPAGHWQVIDTRPAG